MILKIATIEWVKCLRISSSIYKLMKALGQQEVEEEVVVQVPLLVPCFLMVLMVKIILHWMTKFCIGVVLLGGDMFPLLQVGLELVEV